MWQIQPLGDGGGDDNGDNDDAMGETWPIHFDTCQVRLPTEVPIDEDTVMSTTVFEGHQILKVCLPICVIGRISQADLWTSEHHACLFGSMLAT